MCQVPKTLVIFGCFMVRKQGISKLGRFHCFRVFQEGPWKAFGGLEERFWDLRERRQAPRIGSGPSKSYS